MKHCVKILTCFLGIFILFLGLCLNIKAEFVPAHKMIKSFTPVVSKDLNGVATINTSTITTYNRGDMSEVKLGDHNTYWIEPNGNFKDSDLRVVNYCAGTSYMWQGKRPSDLAKIYEREHPGWIVVGGTNGDFFYIGDNCEPLNMHMQEGEMIKAYDWLGGGHGVLGFKDNGETVKGRPDVSSNEKFQVLNKDTNEYETLADIATVDKQPGEGVGLLTRFAITKSPTAIFHEDADLPYDLTDYKVITIKYSMERRDRSTRNVYVKGEVVDITSNKKTYHINDDEEYSFICYKGNELDSVKVGDSVRCQREFQNDWIGVSNAVGYYNQVLENGTIVQWDENSDVNHDYVNPVKNRTIMGFKPDGTPIMMVVDKFKASYGASYEECGAILKSLGCVDGYLFDGGGSSSIFVRDAFGGFEVLNDCQDGNERRDANAILFVMRDPGFKIKVSEETFTTAKVSIDVKNAEYFNKLQNLRVMVDDRSYPYVDGGVIIDGLQDNTLKEIKIQYDLPSYKKVNALSTGAVRTQLSTYELKLSTEVLNVSKTSITLAKPSGNGSELIKNVKATINGNTYLLNEDDKIVCDNLEGDTVYNITVSYDVDAGSGIVYSKSLPSIEVKTVNYELPEILSFALDSKTNDSAKFNFEYIDYDNVVTSAYILYGDGNKAILKRKDGGQTIRDLDFKANSYTFKIVLECSYEGNDFTVESDSISIEQIEPEPVKPLPDKKGCGCKKSQGELIISLLSGVALLGILIKKNN